MGPTPILEMARAYDRRPRLWLLLPFKFAELPWHAEKVADKKKESQMKKRSRMKKTNYGQHFRLRSFASSCFTEK